MFNHPSQNCESHTADFCIGLMRPIAFFRSKPGPRWPCGQLHSARPGSYSRTCPGSEGAGPCLSSPACTIALHGNGANYEGWGRSVCAGVIKPPTAPNAHAMGLQNALVRHLSPNEKGKQELEQDKTFQTGKFLILIPSNHQ